MDAHIHLPVATEQRTLDRSMAILLDDLSSDGVDHAILIPDNSSPSKIGDLPTCLSLSEEVSKIHSGWNSGNPHVAQYSDPQLIASIARRHPRMRIVIAHFFWPEVEYRYEQTHALSNIYYDTSALADAEVVAATGRDRILDVLTRVLASDPARILFGTDYAMCDRSAHLDLTSELAVPDSVRDSVLWKNAAALFRLRLVSA